MLLEKKRHRYITDDAEISPDEKSSGEKNYDEKEI